MRIIKYPQYGTQLDPDVQAFLTATGITDPTIITALSNLVASLKSNGIWSLMYAIYPIVGGTAATHKYNLKDPRDLDVAFRFTFTGHNPPFEAFIHDSNGMYKNSNISSMYCQTHFNPSTDVPSNEGSFGFWTQGLNSGVNGYEMGCRGSGNKNFWTAIHWSDTQSYYSANGVYSQGTYSTLWGSTNEALVISNRIDASNASILMTGNSRVDYSSSYDPPNGEVYFMSCNVLGTGSVTPPRAGYYKFAFIGRSMTTTQMGQLDTAVVAFQSDLGR